MMNTQYFIKIPAQQAESLASLRHWAHLKMATEEGAVWLTGFTAKQMESAEVNQLPNVLRYTAKDAKLFPWGSRLPVAIKPSLLWTAINRALPISTPGFNHNYFGIGEKVAVSLVRASEEQEAMALLVSLEVLGAYIQTAPSIRLQPLAWVLVGEHQALIYGQPLLPLQGTAFWQLENQLLPAGHCLNMPLLAPIIEQKINPKKDHWLVWQEDGSYFLLKKKALTNLSIGSFRKTMRGIED